MRTRTERRALVRELEKISDDAVFEILRHESTDELCALNEFASRRLRDLIQREIRNTDS